MAPIPAYERAILDFLHRLERDGRYDRRAELLKDLGGFRTAGPTSLLRAYALESIKGAAIEPLRCEARDIADLARRGYVSGLTTVQGPGVDRIGLTAAGRELIARNFEEPAAALGPQTITISRSAFGNANIGVQGTATINATSSTSTGADLDRLLTELLQAIEQSDAPAEDKADAQFDVAQLKRELERPRKNGERILQYLKAIPAALNGATAAVSAADALEHAIRALGWFG